MQVNTSLSDEVALRHLIVEYLMESSSDKDFGRLYNAMTRFFLRAEGHRAQEVGQKLAIDILRAFISVSRPAIARRWLGVLLFELLERSSIARGELESAAEIQKLGSLLLTATEDVKLICGLLIRSIMEHQNLPFDRFWPEHKGGPLPQQIFPTKGLRWMEEFNNLIDRLASQGALTESSEIFYPVHVHIDDEFALETNNGAISMMVQSCLVFVQIPLTVGFVQFVDVPVTDIGAVEASVQNLQISSEESVAFHEIMLMSLDGGLSYLMNGSRRHCKGIKIAFRKHEESEEALDSVKHLQATSRARKPSSSQSLDISQCLTPGKGTNLKVVKTLPDIEASISIAKPRGIERDKETNNSANPKSDEYATSKDKSASKMSTGTLILSTVEQTTDKTHIQLPVHSLTQNPVREDKPNGTTPPQTKIASGSANIASNSLAQRRKARTAAEKNARLRPVGNRKKISKESKVLKRTPAKLKNSNQSSSSQIKMRDRLKIANESSINMQALSLPSEEPHGKGTVAPVGAPLKSAQQGLSIPQPPNHSLINLWDIPTDVVEDRDVSLTKNKENIKSLAASKSTSKAEQKGMKRPATRQQARKSTRRTAAHSPVTQDAASKGNKNKKRVNPDLQSSKCQATEFEDATLLDFEVLDAKSNHMATRESMNYESKTTQIPSQKSRQQLEVEGNMAHEFFTRKNDQETVGSQSKPIVVSSPKSSSDLSNIEYAMDDAFIATKDDQQDTQMSMVVDESLARKLTVVGFGPDGAQNQGGTTSIQTRSVLRNKQVRDEIHRERPSPDLRNWKEVCESDAPNPSLFLPSVESRSSGASTTVDKNRLSELSTTMLLSETGVKLMLKEHSHGDQNNDNGLNEDGRNIEDDIIDESVDRLDLEYDNRIDHIKSDRGDQSMNVVENLNQHEKRPRYSPSHQIITPIRRSGLSHPTTVKSPTRRSSVIVNSAGSPYVDETLMASPNERPRPAPPKLFRKRARFQASEDAEDLSHEPQRRLVFSPLKSDALNGQLLSSNRKPLLASAHADSKAISEFAEVQCVEESVAIGNERSDIARQDMSRFRHTPFIRALETSLAANVDDPASLGKTVPEFIMQAKEVEAMLVSSSPDSRDIETETNASHEEYLQWEASLKPYQRNMCDAISRVSRRLTRHLIDSESAIEDILDEYESDGMHLITEMAKIHGNHMQAYGATTDQGLDSFHRLSRDVLKQHTTKPNFTRECQMMVEDSAAAMLWIEGQMEELRY